MSGRFRTDIDALVVLLHCKQRLGFSQVRADELGILFDCYIAVAYRTREGHQLNQSSCPIRIAAWIIRCTLRHFSVGFNRSWPVRLLELLVAEFASFVGLFGVDVCIFLSLDLGLFCSTQFIENIWGAVFGKGFLIVQDGFGQVAKLLIRCADSTECPSTCKHNSWLLALRLLTYFAIILKSARTSLPCSIAFSHVSMAP